jgi:hypothetical protein
MWLWRSMCRNSGPLAIFAAAIQSRQARTGQVSGVEP